MNPRVQARLVGALFLGGLLAVGCGMATRVDDEPPVEDETPWVLDCCTPFRECADGLRKYGLSLQDAEDVTHLIFYGEYPQYDKLGCSYYVVTMYFCRNGIRYNQPMDVKTQCLEENLELCAPMLCPAVVGDTATYRPFFITTLGQQCNPPGACVWFDIDGPYTTNDLTRCEQASDCSCFAEATCESRVCRPVVGVDLQPRGCPSCGN